MPIFLMVFAVLVRLIPHPWNMAPIGAFGLFAGSRLPLHQAILIPLLPLLISDLLIGYQGYDYALLSMVSVYGASLLSVFLGRFLIGKKTLSGQKLGGRVVVAVLAQTALFFLITNGVLIFTPAYPLSLDGLLQSYVLGLPFLSGSLLGDGFYSLLLFGGAFYARFFYPQVFGFLKTIAVKK